MCAGRTLRQFPFVAEQVREEVVAPLRRRGGPGNFQAAADGVTAMAFAEFILPTEALLLDAGTLWFGAYIISRNGSAVSFAERVTTGNERNRFFVVHCHAGESLADIARGSDRVGLSIRPFRVHIDQTHLHGSERIRKIAIAAV